MREPYRTQRYPRIEEQRRRRVARASDLEPMVAELIS